MNHHYYELFAVAAEATMVIMFHILAHHRIRGAIPAGFTVAAMYLVATSYYLWVSIAPPAPVIA